MCYSVPVHSVEGRHAKASVPYAGWICPALLLCLIVIYSNALERLVHHFSTAIFFWRDQPSPFASFRVGLIHCGLVIGAQMVPFLSCGSRDRLEGKMTHFSRWAMFGNIRINIHHSPAVWVTQRSWMTILFVHLRAIVLSLSDF